MMIRDREVAERPRDDAPPASSLPAPTRNGSESARLGDRSAGPPPLPRALLAELVGTFVLTFVAAGAEVVAARTGGEPSGVGRAVAPGLAVMAMIFALGSASGAHINPGATLAFALRGVFPWLRVGLYWAAQLLGAILAAAVLREVVGDAAHLGATLPKFGERPAFFMELVLASILFGVILSTAEENSRIGKQAALPVGGVVALGGLFAAPVSGASMNPARSLGPAIVSGHLQGQWLYVAAPLLASAIAAGVTWLLCPQEDPKAPEAAQGRDA